MAGRQQSSACKLLQELSIPNFVLVPKTCLGTEVPPSIKEGFWFSFMNSKVSVMKALDGIFGDEARLFTDTGDFPMSQRILWPLCFPGDHSCCSFCCGLSKSNCVIPSIVDYEKILRMHYDCPLQLYFPIPQV